MMHYFAWHYTTAYRDYFRVWLNYLWFVAHFFSLGILLRTFFSPFKRIQEKSKKGFDIQSFFEALAVNSLMRLVGMLVRLVLISLGIATLGVVLLTGIVGILVWTLLPIALAALVVISIFGWDSLIVS